MRNERFIGEPGTVVSIILFPERFTPCHALAGGGEIIKIQLF